MNRGSFKASAPRRTSELFREVRPRTEDHVIDAIHDYRDCLPEDTQTQVPLVKMRPLAENDA